MSVLERVPGVPIYRTYVDSIAPFTAGVPQEFQVRIFRRSIVYAACLNINPRLLHFVDAMGTGFEEPVLDVGPISVGKIPLSVSPVRLRMFEVESGELATCSVTWSADWTNEVSGWQQFMLQVIEVD